VKGSVPPPLGAGLIAANPRLPASSARYLHQLTHARRSPSVRETLSATAVSAPRRRSSGR
jgi:hypothetical protein